MKENGSHLEAGSDEVYLNDLLRKWQEGSSEAYDELFVLLHEDLKQIAHFKFLNERAGHTLQTGDLVNKLYLKLKMANANPWKDHEHFRRSAARAMNQILIDHARGWVRRPTGKDKIGMDGLNQDHIHEFQDKDVDLLRLLAIKEAIEKMARLDPTMAKIAYQKLVPGHSLQKISEDIGWDINKVKREWQIIKKFIGPAVW